MTQLSRRLGLAGLAATGICSMIGASINVVPIMIHRSVPGIGPYVLPAFLFAAVPALLAALAYAILASAMPRAGGSYLYASRGLSPYLGFVASFSQWFGLSIVIGVVSYLIVPFFRDIATALGWSGLAATLDIGMVRVGVSLALLWLFVGINLLGVAAYQRTVIPLMVLMFVLGGVVIVAGFSHDQSEFAVAALARDGHPIPEAASVPFNLRAFLSASAVLFSSFIGFDSIAQAGGEAKNPGRNLPLAIGIAMVVVGTFYFLFASAMYHAVPWGYIAREAATRDLTAPGLLGYLLPAGWTVAIVAGAAVALTNDLPAMLLAVSRLMFAWAADGIFPRQVAAIHPRWHTPHVAILISGLVSTVGIVGSHWAGDFFLGIDIMIISMLVNFLLMCLAVLTLPRRNPVLARAVTVVRHRPTQVALAMLGILMLSGFLVVQVWKDLSSPVDAWYFRSTPVWLIVMVVGSVVYFRETNRLRTAGVDLAARFSVLPEE